LEKLKNGDFEENYIDEAKLNQINQINESIQKNSFLAYAINTYFFENESITTINNLDDAVQSISNYEIVKFSKKTFTDNFIQATLLPK
jgi:predicted Zn-dependent peptidase